MTTLYIFSAVLCVYFHPLPLFWFEDGHEEGRIGGHQAGMVWRTLVQRRSVVDVGSGAWAFRRSMMSW